MILLFKLLDSILKTRLYFFIRLEEIKEFVKENQFNEAEDSLKLLLEDIKKLNYPLDFQAEIYLYLAETVFKKKNIMQSIKYCKKAIEIEARPHFYYRVGWLYYYKLLDPENAIIFIDKAIELNPNYYESLKLGAYISFNLQQKNKVLKYAIKALNIKKDTQLHIILGQIDLEKNNFKSADKNFESAIELEQDNADAYYYLGSSKLRQKEYDAALKNFSQATFYNNKLSSAYFELARIHQFIKHEYDKALVAYNKVLELDKNNEEALYNFSLILANHKNNFTKATFLIFHLLKQNPKHEEAILLLADIYEKRYNYTYALKYLEQISLKVPNLEKRKAILYYKLGKWEKIYKDYFHIYQSSKIFEKVFLYNENKIHTILCWKEKNGTIYVEAIKKNGPFVIDVLSLKLLEEYKYDDIFHSFKENEVSKEEGFLIISRWLTEPVLIFENSLLELNKLAKKYNFIIPQKELGLLPIFYTLFDDHKTIINNLKKLDLKDQITKIDELLKEGVALLKKDPLILSLFLKIPWSNKIFDLPKIEYHPELWDNFIKNLEFNSNNNNLNITTSNHYNTIISSNNFDKNLKIILINSNNLNDVLNEILFNAIKKSHTFTLCTNENTFTQIYKCIKNILPNKDICIIGNNENYICLNRLYILIESDYDKLSLIKILRLILSENNLLILSIEPIYQKLREALNIISPANNCDDTCEYKIKCQYYNEKIKLEKSKIKILTKKQILNFLDSKNILKSGKIVFFNVLDTIFTNLFIHKLKFSDIKNEIYFWHKYFINFEKTNLKEAEELILRLQNHFSNLRRDIEKLKNHLMIYPYFLKWSLFRTKFPQIYFDINEKILNIINTIEILTSYAIGKETNKNIITRLKNYSNILSSILSENTHFSGIKIDKNIEDCEFSFIRKIDFKNIKMIFNDFICFESKLDNTIIQNIKNLLPFKINIYNKQTEKINNNINLKWDNYILENIELKYLQYILEDSFWPNFLQYYLYAYYYSKGYKINQETINFFSSKNTKYNLKVTDNNIEAIIDILFFPIFNKHNFLNTLENILKNKKNQNIDFNEYMKFLSILTFISRIEGKKVLIITTSILARLSVKILSKLGYWETTIILKSEKLEDYENKLKFIKSGVAKLIFVEYPVHLEEKLSSILEEIKINYIFNLNTLYEQNKINFEIKQKELKFTNKIKKNNTLYISKTNILLPDDLKWDYIYLNNIIPEYNEIMLLSNSKKRIFIDINSNKKNDLSNNIKRLLFFNFSILSKILSYYKNKKIVLSSRIISEFVKYYPIFENPTNFIKTLEQSNIINIESYIPPYLNLYFRKTGKKIFYDLTYGYPDFNKYIANIKINFKISENLDENKKKWFENILLKIKLLEFLNKDIKLQIHKKNTYSYENLCETIGLSSKELLNILDEFQAHKLISILKLEKNILIEILNGSISCYLKEIINEKELALKTIDVLTKLNKKNKNDFNLIALWKKLSPSLTLITVEKTLIILEINNLIYFDIKTPFLDSGYLLSIKEKNIENLKNKTNKIINYYKQILENSNG